MRLTLVIGGLGCGGAERVLASMANYWVDQGWEISLITLAAAENDFFPLDARVNRKGLALTAPAGSPLRGLVNNLRRVFALRRAILDTSPQAVISFTDTSNIRVLFALAGTGLPVVVSERTDPRCYDPGWIWRLLRRCLYPHAARVVMVARDSLSWARRHWPRWRVTAIPNAVFCSAEPPRERPSWLGNYNLVAMGRLHPVKGFVRIIEAFAGISRQFPEWRLVILGEGEERPRLESLAGALGIADQVVLPGAVQAPRSVLAHADLFVLASHREGFPMALAEAMACGLPAVSMDIRSGPAELIRPEVDGLLTPADDIPALGAALARLMRDEPLRRRMARRAVEVGERFSTHRVMGEWDALLAEVALLRKGGGE